MYNIECDGVDICVNGTFDCEDCAINKRSRHSKKPVPKKPKMVSAPQKQFKRRKK